MGHNGVPRLVVYHQTTHDPSGNLISILPLITRPGVSVSHLIIAAIHINEDPDGLTLNDHPPAHPRFASTWAELRVAQASGIKVLGMLGGAAKGSYTRLDKAEATFETYYQPLYAMIKERGLDGLDLDVEEPMSLAGIIRLIDRLRADFGPVFLITLAPVAAALLDSRRNLSGFDYEALEVMRGKQIAWYNAQFYCGWGDASTPVMYQMCLARGWMPEKVVMGLVTTPANGAGWVPFELLGSSLQLIKRSIPNFGGVMGWEYFNSKPGDTARPWEWAERMTGFLDRTKQISVELPGSKPVQAELDPDKEEGAEPEAPNAFDYHSDGLEDEQ
ncbi:family 18 glycoside hydrolase [Microdochium trichocladiopsis]|uniref:Family 18 glycoside hydrolase n=1 Tax=Microdochium trichocladiopsis TaxID=1682393 RepID=A0A9P9BV96_9PEZI|nr:family 18 glycoside hydrolase [Microdochium trichocladiopsis]KAH7033102.1 family 18 glycoside hydrolase [Microdochium trichocladiopsis]